MIHHKDDLTKDGQGASEQKTFGQDTSNYPLNLPLNPEGGRCMGRFSRGVLFKCVTGVTRASQLRFHSRQSCPQMPA